MKKLLLLPLLVLSLQAADFPLEMSGARTADRKSAFIMNVLAPKECGEIKLNRYDDKFSLSINDDEQDIPNYMVSKPLRQMTPKQLAGFLQSNYLTLKQCSDGEFSLEDHGRLHGGGMLGTIIGGAGGYVAGKVVAEYTILVGGTIVLLGTQKVIGAYAGPAAEAEFAEKLQTRILPNLRVAAEKLGTVVAVAGAGAGGVASGPL